MFLMQLTLISLSILGSPGGSPVHHPRPGSTEWPPYHFSYLSFLFRLIYYLDSLLGSLSLLGLLGSGVLVGSTGPIGFSLGWVSSHSIERGWEGSLSPQISLA